MIGDCGDTTIVKGNPDKDARSWMTIGEHRSRAALQQTAKKIRSKWAERYDFQICQQPDTECFELRLRHR